MAEGAESVRSDIDLFHSGRSVSPDIPLQNTDDLGSQSRSLLETTPTRNHLHQGTIYLAKR